MHRLQFLIGLKHLSDLKKSPLLSNQPVYNLVNLTIGDKLRSASYLESVLKCVKVGPITFNVVFVHLRESAPLLLRAI